MDIIHLAQKGDWNQIFNKYKKKPTVNMYGENFESIFGTTESKIGQYGMQERLRTKVSSLNVGSMSREELIRFKWGIRKKPVKQLGLFEIFKKGLKSNIGKSLLKGGFLLGDIALVTSLVTPLFSAAGTFVSGKSEQVERLTRIFDRKSLDFGGKIHTSYLNGPGMTERQRSLQALQQSRSNARTLFGGEAQLYHS